MSLPPFFKNGTTHSRGTFSGSGRGTRSTKSQDPDRPVRETDVDASVARISAVSKKYLVDEFATLFATPSSSRDTSRPPWVNIGTHHRTYVIDAIVERFLRQSEGVNQVISLGAGSDSRFWRLKRRLGDRWPLVKWVETDFKATTSQKIKTIMSHDPLRQLCGDQITLSCSDNLSLSNSAEHPPTELYGDQYCLLSTDLREPLGLVEKLSAPPPGEGAVQGPLLSRTAPTLIIAELVFLYLSPEHTDACLKTLTNLFEGPLMIVSYEALNLDDNFSKMMVQNLATRGLSLAGFSHNRSLESQIERMQKHGYQEIVSTDMKTLRLGSITSGSNREDEDDEWKKEWETELNRIRKLEFLDEVEELELILLHYAITWATKNFPHSSTTSPKTTVGFYLPRL
ncbi:hypothetical protein Pst134EA_033415 [Puccinia striiformis f. sp. tritici]|uniref:hypothetical protein n=1 Tax=Puccinia striiformis f. sp. tritici TaxID=168172 RepID=UPI002008DB6F|nr:hypothetical protein Pst134EA_033415 [Puccinia striiformis f. sp. tritici]KAH9468095.1 hypothetical protein Pst134EA_033415 [Puccinia striiformis f. sp. tritici]